jgi:DNA-binding NarL/FixJ family response regulator
MSRTILLVEDEHDARISLARAIERAGYSCTSAATYDEAVALSPEGILSACVVDIVLGDDDTGGLRLIPHLRSLPGRPPVIVITAFADVEKVKTALNAGAAYLLEKPFRAPQLLDVLARFATDPGEFRQYIDAALSRARLTEKETSVARLLLKGLTSQEIARVESNSEKTIRQHVSQIYAKCGVSTRAEFFHFVFPS